MKIESDHCLRGKRILIGVCGSIAAVKTPLLVSNLVKAGAEVRCIITPSATHLVSPLSLATLSRNRAYQDKDQWDPIEPKPLHVTLAEWAELVVIAPLSATSLAQWVHGLGEGLLGSVLLACEKPIIAAAAMNTGMWKNLAVQENWGRLQAFPKVLCLSPSSGLLACDREGEGRMPDPELIELAIKSVLIRKDSEGIIQCDWKGQRVLITAGPTLESLDPARLITNRSSGRMGVLLAQAAKLRGASVDLIHGPLQLSSALLEGLTTYPVKSAQEMQTKLTKLQTSANVIIMTAAVSDIRRKNGATLTKANKTDLINSLGNDFETVPDLLAEAIQRKTNNQLFMGFSALTGENSDLQMVGEQKRRDKGCDLLFANPIDRPGQGFEEHFNGGFLLGPGSMAKPMPIASKLLLAHQLLDEIRTVQTNISQSN